MRAAAVCAWHGVCGVFAYLVIVEEDILQPVMVLALDVVDLDARHYHADNTAVVGQQRSGADRSTLSRRTALRSFRGVRSAEGPVTELHSSGWRPAFAAVLLLCPRVDADDGQQVGQRRLA